MKYQTKNKTMEICEKCGEKFLTTNKAQPCGMCSEQFVCEFCNISYNRENKGSHCDMGKEGKHWFIPMRLLRWVNANYHLKATDEVFNLREYPEGDKVSIERYANGHKYWLNMKLNKPVKFSVLGDKRHIFTVTKILVVNRYGTNVFMPLVSGLGENSNRVLVTIAAISQAIEVGIWKEVE